MLRRISMDGIEIDEATIKKLCEALPGCEVNPMPGSVAKEVFRCRQQAALALPKPPMPDMRGWIQRARQFCRHLKGLGGEQSALEFSAGRPASSNDCDRLADLLQNALPASLRTFFEQGARNLSFRYSWNPPPARAAYLRKVLDGNVEVWGGGTFGPLLKLVEYQKNCLEYAEDSWLSENSEFCSWPQEKAEWIRTVPFLRMANGDYLALDPGLDAVDPPVLYLCHDSSNQIIAPNLAAFLLEWESLAYIGPESWMIEGFCDRATGCLDSRTARAEELRKVFR